MIEKTRLKDIGNVAVSIILLITYYFYFGKDSFQRYLEKRIIITEHEEKHVTIPPPGKHLTKSCYNKSEFVAAIVVFPQNLKTRDTGWKQYHMYCKGSGVKFTKCIERITYNETDIFAKANQSFNVNSFYVDLQRVVVQSLEMGEGLITQNSASSLQIKLNNKNNLSYIVEIVDPRLQIFSRSPDTIPRSWFKLNEHSVAVYFHMRLNYLSKNLNS